MPCKNITNNSNLDLKQYQSLFDDFFPYSQERLGYDKPFSLNLTSDEENYKNPLGKTAHYDPSSYEVTIYTDGRHIKDILRSLSHELVHHAQNCRGEFGKGLDTSAGYAQEDGHLRNMEKEAYLEGNLLFRDWEDQKKQKTEVKKMNLKEMVKKELKKVLSEQGYGEPTSGLEDLTGQSLPAQQGLGRKSYERPKHKRKRKRKPSPKLALMQAKLNLALQGAAKEGKKVTRVEIPVDGLPGRKTRQAIRDINRAAELGNSSRVTVNTDHAMYMFGSKVTPDPNRYAVKAVTDLFAGKELAGLDKVLQAPAPKMAGTGVFDDPAAKTAATKASVPPETTDWEQKLKDTPAASGYDDRRKFLKRNIKEKREGFQESESYKNLQEGAQPSKKLPMYEMRDNKVFKLLIEESVK